MGYCLIDPLKCTLTLNNVNKYIFCFGVRIRFTLPEIWILFVIGELKS